MLYNGGAEVLKEYWFENYVELRQNSNLDNLNKHSQLQFFHLHKMTVMSMSQSFGKGQGRHLIYPLDT